MQSLQARLEEAVRAAFAAAGADPAFGRVQLSDRPDLAPYQCNGALAAAKAARANPRALAEAVAAPLRADPRFADVSLAGPGFLNLTPATALVEAVIAEMAADPACGAYARPVGERERVIIDYGGPNVAKPLHVGHLRSAIIGEAMKRLFRAAGDDVLGDIHLGDWGLQMGQLIVGLAAEQPDLPYFDPNQQGPYPAESPVTVEDLAALYPRASAASKADEAFRQAARRATAELQAGRPGYRALWAHFVGVSRPALARDYAELGVSFDLWKGEADVDARIPALIDRLDRMGLLEDSDGARIIRVARETDSKEIPPLIMVSSEGSVLYASTDLATIEERVADLGAQRIIYVVDQRQSQHFEQVFRAAAQAGLIDEHCLEHTGFGTMNGRDGTPFKTREGGVLRLRELIDDVIAEAGRRLEGGALAADLSPTERTEIARRVGIAALKFADLANPRVSDYIFDLDRFMAFEGKTGPYLLYAIVRIRSVLARIADKPDAAAPIRLSGPAELELALTLSGYAEAVEAAYHRRLPHLLCEHAFRVAQAFSRFYAACRVADEADPTLRASRIRLARLTHDQLVHALDILAIAVPDRM